MSSVTLEIPMEILKELGFDDKNDLLSDFYEYLYKKIKKAKLKRVLEEIEKHNQQHSQELLSENQILDLFD